MLLIMATCLPVTTACAATPDSVAGAALQSQAVTQTAKPAVSQQRLKYKSSGPICLCSGGLSERDIEEAMARLARGPETTDAPPGMNASTTPEQTTRRTQ
jgi:hypothetical protein